MKSTIENDKKEVVHTSKFTIEACEFGNEIQLVTDFVRNGDPGGLFLNQQLVLTNEEGGTIVKIDFYTNTFDEEILKKLLNHIKTQRAKAVSKM